MENSITREITINATKERIYDAVANPEKVVLWFPEKIIGQYEVGEQPIFSFGEHGKNQVYIVDATPHKYFAYRWVPGGNNFLGDVLSISTTLVEFRIEEAGSDSCKLTVTESGFNELPVEIMEQSFNQNSGGWNFMLGRLTSYFENA